MPRRTAGKTGRGERWGAIAVTIANNGVAAGYAGGKGSAGSAAAAAIGLCATQGRPGCHLAINAFHGCAYISLAAEGESRSGWGTGATPAVAMANCQANGIRCNYPFGGCS